MKKLAIITTHPIQYNAPWFKLLSERGYVDVKVFYTWSQIENGEKYDPGFKKNIRWDLPLLDGYHFDFVKNTSKYPGSHHFNGIKNPSLIREIELYDPVAILVIGWCFKSHLKVLRYFKSKKLILFRGDSNLVDQKKGNLVKKIIRKIFLTWVYSKIDKALYVGSANKIYFKQYYIKEGQLVFAPHAVDNFRFKSTNLIEIPQVNIPKDSIVFLFTGKFEEKKDPTILLKCFIEMDISTTHLLFVGNGILENNLKNIAFEQSPSIRSRIHFLPFQNQLKMPGIYKLADIIVLPSRGPHETWGLSINEAMACSKVVIVSDKCGCASDLVSQGENGYIFKHSNSEDLLSIMKSVAKKKDLLIGMGKKSLEKIENWNFENICLSVEQVIISSKN